MNGGALRRVVEAFFRRWPFYFLLLVLAMALGFRSVANTTDTYTSSGAIFVDSQTLVTTQSGVQDGGFRSYLSPSRFTAQELGGLISTDIFMESMLARAEVDLQTNPVERSAQVRRLRRSISTTAPSESLVQVNVTTSDPELSSRIALATIDEFVQFQISVSIAESSASEAFFTGLVADYQTDLLEARREVNSALVGVESLEDLTPEAQLELERLQQAEVLAAARFRAAVEDVEASRLAMLQTETDVRQRLSTFDPPQTPEEPNGSFLDDVTVLATFAMVGLMIALLGPVISALLSRGVIFADDLDLGHDARVIGVIPRVRRKTLKLDQVEVTAQSADISFGPAGQRQTAAPTVQPAPVAGQTNGDVANSQANSPWLAPAAVPAQQPVAVAPLQPLPVVQPVTANGAAANPATPVNGAAVAQPAAVAPPVEAEPVVATPRWARPVDATSELPIGAKAVPASGSAGVPSSTQPPSPAVAPHEVASPGANGSPAAPATEIAGATKPGGSTPGADVAGFDDLDLGADFDDLDDEDELSGNVVKVDPTRRTNA